MVEGNERSIVLLTSGMSPDRVPGPALSTWTGLVLVLVASVPKYAHVLLPPFNRSLESFQCSPTVDAFDL